MRWLESARGRQLRLPFAHRETWWALAGLALVVVLLFWEAIVGGRVFFDRDIHIVYLAQVEAFVRSVAAGSWPVWDTSMGFGQPMLANPTTQVLYPPHWTSLLLAPGTQYTLYASLHLWFGGVGLFALARRLGCSTAAASFGAAIWMASGPLLSLLTVWQHFGGACWMPWVLLAAIRAFDSRQLSAALTWGAASALQLLAGSADMFVLTALVAGLMLTIRLATSAPTERHARRRLSMAAIAAVFGAALAAGMWLPTLEVALRARRSAMLAADRGVWSVHPLSLPQLLIPIDFEWLPEVAPELTGPLQELWQPFVRSVYLGAAAMCAVAAGALVGSRRRLRQALSVAACAALFYSLGRHTPLYGWAVSLIPGAGMLRYPSKFSVGLACAWALLAALGLDTIARGLATHTRRWLAVAAGCCSALCLAALLIGATSPGGGGSALTALLEKSVADLGLAALLSGAAGTALLLPGLKATSRAVALGLIAVADLVGVNRGLNPTTDGALFRYRPEVLDTIGHDPLTRIYVADYSVQIPGKATHGRLGMMLQVPGEWPRRMERALAMQAYLLPPAAGRWGLSGSFDRDLLELYPKPLRDLALGLRHLEQTPGFDRLLRRGGVNYVLALHEEGHEKLRAVATVAGLYPVPIRVYRVPGALPRAYAVSGVERVVSPDAALRRLVAPEFDASRAVLLEEGERREPRGSPGRVRVAELHPDRVRIEAVLEQPGHVVLLDSYDPGWRVRVDGRPATLLRANGVFRAVAVPSGAHEVDFVYRPDSVRVGLAVSLIALCGGLGYAATGLTRPRQGGHPPELARA